jgi:hypothetical protein
VGARFARDAASEWFATGDFSARALWMMMMMMEMMMMMMMMHDPTVLRQASADRYVPKLATKWRKVGRDPSERNSRWDRSRWWVVVGGGWM